MGEKGESDGDNSARLLGDASGCSFDGGSESNLSDGSRLPVSKGVFDDCSRRKSAARRDGSEENLRLGSESVTCYFNPTHALGATFSVMDNRNSLSSSPCSVCSEVLQRKQRLFFSKDGQFDYDHHKTAESLRQSSQQLCYICTTVWTSLSMAEKEIILTALYKGHCTKISLLSSEIMAPGSDDHRDSIFLVVGINASEDNIAIGMKTTVASVMFLMQPSESKQYSLSDSL